MLNKDEIEWDIKARKTTVFENKLDDLVTEVFSTKEELKWAIDCIGDIKLSYYLENNMCYYE